MRGGREPSTRRRGGAGRLLRLPGVYRPQADTELLIEALASVRLGPGTAVLDVCTGTGAVAVAAARAGAGRVTAVDCSRRAVWSARWNARGLRGAVTALRADATDPAACAAVAGPFDVIVCNPPYVPTPAGTRTRGRTRAWNAGESGRSIVDPLCRLLPARLRPGGALLMVQSEFADVARTVHSLRGRGLEAGVLLERRIPFGPVLTERREFLRQAGLLTTAKAASERIAVVMARSSAQRPSQSGAPAARTPAGAPARASAV